MRAARENAGLRASRCSRSLPARVPVCPSRTAPPSSSRPRPKPGRRGRGGPRDRAERHALEGAAPAGRRRRRPRPSPARSRGRRRASPTWTPTASASPGPTAGVGAAAPPPAVRSRRRRARRRRGRTFMARVDVTPEAGVAVKIEVLDAVGPDACSRRSGADPGQTVSVPNLPTRRRRRRSCACAARRPGEAPGSYRMVVRVLPLEPGAEIEPDDAIAQANELPLPGEAIGYLGWRRDQDYLSACRPPGWRRGACWPPTSIRSRASARASRWWTPPGKKLSEARGRRGERVALRNVLVPPGHGPAVPGRVRRLRLERRPALRHARQRRAAEAGRRGGAQRRRRRTRRRSPTAPCRATSRAATSTSSGTPPARRLMLTVEIAPPERATAEAGDRQRGRASSWRAASRPGKAAASRCAPACGSKAATS